MAENWFSHFKTEFYYHQGFATHREAEAAILGYIESWYNRRRPNERAGGYPPMHAWIDYETSDQDNRCTRPSGGRDGSCQRHESG